MTGPAIQVDGLAMRYAGRTVLDGLSLTVDAGEVVALVGPNGAGKTTTVETIEGYRRAQDGRVEVLGTDPWTAGRAHRARVGLMLQDGGLDMRARPAESLRQYAGFHGDPLDPERLLDELGLRAVAWTPYRRLSGGERQRLGFALALIGRPEVLVLDEPTAGMDAEARAVVRGRIAAERHRGVAVLVTSHDLADMERMADRVAVIVRGQVVAAGPAPELGATLRPRLRFRLDRPLEPDAGAALAGLLGTAIEPDGDGARYVAAGDPTPERLAALSAWAADAGRRILEVRTSGGSLEDVYLELVGSEAPR